MSNKNLFKQKSGIDLAGYQGKSASVLNRHQLFGLLAFVILAALFASLIYQQYRIIKQEQKKEGFAVAANAKENFNRYSQIVYQLPGYFLFLLTITGR